jgi:hypothetical protein
VRAGSAHQLNDHTDGIIGRRGAQPSRLANTKVLQMGELSSEDEHIAMFLPAASTAEDSWRLRHHTARTFSTRMSGILKLKLSVCNPPENARSVWHTPCKSGMKETNRCSVYLRLPVGVRRTFLLPLVANVAQFLMNLGHLHKCKPIEPVY